jgi:hypothetical protein
VFNDADTDTDAAAACAARATESGFSVRRRSDRCFARSRLRVLQQLRRRGRATLACRWLYR